MAVLSGKLTRTMRVGINTPLYRAIIGNIEKGLDWALEAKVWRITGANRIEGTDFVRLEMEEV
jgi:hypothetical protein